MIKNLFALVLFCLQSCVPSKNDITSIHNQSNSAFKDGVADSNSSNTYLYISGDSCTEANGPTPKLGYDLHSTKATPELLMSLGGGKITNNSFQIELLLSCKSSITGDINGLGLYYSWVYIGNSEEGNIDTYGGFENNIKWRNGTIGNINSGFIMPGVWTGISLEGRFPNKSDKEFDIVYTLFVESPLGNLGGVILTFTNLLSGEMVRPININIRGLTTEELKVLNENITYR